MNWCPHRVQRSFILMIPENTCPSRHWGQRWRTIARRRAREGRRIPATLERLGQHPHDTGREVERMAVEGVDRPETSFQPQAPATTETNTCPGRRVKRELSYVRPARLVGET